MCLVMKEDLDKMLVVINDYIGSYKGECLSDDLKDYLSDLKESGKISYCGCDGLFKVKVVDNNTYVYIEITGRIYVFFINDNECFYKQGSYMEASPEMYEIPDNWND